VQYTSGVENSLDDFTVAVCAAARSRSVWRGDKAGAVDSRPVRVHLAAIFCTFQPSWNSGPGTVSPAGEVDAVQRPSRERSLDCGQAVLAVTAP
jgi:hypothetical protein